MSSSHRGALALLSSAGDNAAATHTLVGLDGFVDSIIRVVEKKLPNGQRTHFASIPGLARRIANAAGKSTALELIIERVKLGGNGPIMANALSCFGMPVTYIGAIGQGTEVHPVFQPMGERCSLLPVCDAASTDALEFDDGKLMLQKLDCLDSLDYPRLEKCLGREKLLELFEASSAVALNNWSSMPHMSAIWERLLGDICPNLTSRQRHIFFDLADPEKHDHEHTRGALALVSRFQQYYDTTLGLNEKESEHICEILGLALGGTNDRSALVGRAERVRAALQIGSVVIHPVAFAAAADAGGSAIVDGPYVEKPLISTGAGDHFNAGYFLGRCLGGDLAACLQLGVATSGYYVRTAESPALSALADFIESLA